jgi:hypothetical protein
LQPCGALKGKRCNLYPLQGHCVNGCRQRLKIESRPPQPQYDGVTRFRRLLLALCCLLLPATARADGIDLPVLIGDGVGILVPLLAFNATMEAPIMGRFLGVRFSELWWPWFKANVWSLLSGIPVLFVDGALKEWWVPTELGARVRVYPIFLFVSILIYLLATVLVEFLYARRLVREAEPRIAKGKLLKAVALANVASYVVLGPVFYVFEYPRTDIREFTANTSWANQPALTVLAVGPEGRLERADLSGQDRRVVLPHVVQDYVVSSNLTSALYRGEGDRFYLFQSGTNVTIPELGFWCRAPEMDFSPAGRYAAFFNSGTHQIRVFDSRSGQLKDVLTFGDGTLCTLVWSSKEDTLYLKSGKEYWEISLEPSVAYRRLAGAPDDFANHYGRVGTTWSRDGVFYTSDQRAGLRLYVVGGWGSRLSISRDRERVMQVNDPAGGLGVHQAVFLDDNEVLVELGGYVYLVDIALRRMGPVMRGERAIALSDSYRKRLDF